MARTSPIHYIAPSAIAITPNANNSANDLAVYIAKGAKIKVCYQPIADLAYDDANIRQWTLKGRNRRLADASVPYTIYARLKKTDPTDGYLVFAPQTQDEATGEWQDPYILSPNTSATSAMRAEGADGNKYLWGAIPERQAAEGRSDYWWVRLGSVSLADTGGQRTVDLDTGTLGTDQYNKDWYLDPDKMPQRPVRIIYVERGEWAATPMATYTGETGSMAPDGTLPAAVAQALGWEGTDVLTFTTGQEINEPYHYRSLTRCRWLTHRLAEYNAGYTDAELYEELTTPSSGWEEENWVETSRVWRDGRLWECLVEGATDVPGEDSLQWKLLLQGGENALNVELTKSSDAVVIDPSGNVVGGYRTVSKDSSGNEFYTYRFHTSVTVMKGGEYLHLCGALDDGEELGDGNFTVDAVGAGCDLKVEGTTCYITYIWHCNDGDAGTDPYTSYNRTPEDYQLMRAMTEAVAHITLNIEGRTSVTKDYRLQLVHLPTDTITIESHNEIAAMNWSTKKNAWTNKQDIVIPLTASSGGQPVRFQTVNGGTAPDIRLLSQPGWLSGYSVAWADYDEDGDGRAEYTASQHMSVEITIPIANILRTWQEGGTAKEIPTTNLLKFNVTTVVDGVEYENVVPFTLNVTTDKAVYVLAPSVRQVTGTMIGGTWDPQTNTVSNARYSYVAAGEACNKVTCKLMCYDQNDNLTEITSASAIHDNLTFFINGAASTLEGFRTTGVSNTPVSGKNHNLFDEMSEIVFAIKMDGRDYESEGVPILRNGADLSIGDDGNWYIGGVNTEVFAKGTEVTDTFIYYTEPMDVSTPPEYTPTESQRGKPVSPYLKTACPASVEGKFIHYVSITVFSDSEETYVYAYGTIGTGNTITVIHDRDYYASASELTQAQLKAIAEANWSESTPANYSATNKYLYGRDTARYYKNGAEQTITVGGISYPHIVYAMLAYWGQDGSGVEFAYYRAADDSQANKPTVTVLNQRHPGTDKNPAIADWSGSDGGWYDDNPGFTAQGQVMYQSVNKYSNGTWSGWGDPKIIDRFAQDSVIMDLSNEYQMVFTSSEGTVVTETSVVTAVLAYHGMVLLERQPTAATLTPKTGSPITPSVSSDVAQGKTYYIVTYTIPKGVVLNAKHDLDISITYQGNTYTKQLTVAASMGSPEYHLDPNYPVIPFRRKSDNTLEPSSWTLTMRILKFDMDDSEEMTIANSGMIVRYTTNGTPPSSMTSGKSWGTSDGSTGISWSSGNMVIANSTDVGCICVAMYNTAGVLLDRETIPVIKDGKDGTSITKSGETYRYATNNTGTRPAATSTAWSTTKPTLQKGYWLYTETTITWSDGSKTVLYTAERNPNDGVAGQDIIVDGSTEVTYCVSDSNTSQPADSSFKAYSQIILTKGKWLWAKATTYYRKASSAAGSHDAGSSSNYTVSYIPTDGTDGRALTGVTEYYKATDSPSSYSAAPSSDTGWTTDPNSAGWGASKKYLWNYEKATYSSGTTVERTIPTVIAIWTKDGKGIDSITNYYLISASATGVTRNTSGWDDDPIAPTADAPYLWNYEKIHWTDGTDTYTEPQVIGHFGKNGEQGPQGKYEEKQYCRSAAETSANGSTPPTNIDTSVGSSGWSTTPPATKVQYPFIWQRTRTYNPADNTYGSWVYTRLTGGPGKDGAAGKAGLWYAYAGVWGTDISSVTNTETQGWYVKSGDKWYMNVEDAGVANTTTPGENVDGWELMSSVFKYYIAEAYFGNYAHFGSFIINGDWMISQYGTVNGVSYTSTRKQNGYYGYLWFDPSIPFENHQITRYNTTGYNFIPNFAVDGLTGKTYQNDAYIKGQIVAASGKITGTMTVGTYGSGVNSIQIVPSTTNPSIVGYVGTTESFRLGTKISGIWGNVPTIKIGRSYFTENGLHVLDADGSNCRAYSTRFIVERVINNSHYPFTIDINSSGKVVMGPNGSSMWPTSRSEVGLGDIYLDGDTLKVRTN